MFLLPYKFCCWDPNKNHRENIFGGSWQKWKKNSGEGCETKWNETNVKWNEMKRMWNEMKRNETNVKRNEIKRNETKWNECETKWNKMKQNETNVKRNEKKWNECERKWNKMKRNETNVKQNETKWNEYKHPSPKFFFHLWQDPSKFSSPTIWLGFQQPKYKESNIFCWGPFEKCPQL